MTNLTIHTAQYAYKGEDRLDITMRTGEFVFAPTWGMIFDLKEGEITEDEYRGLYLKRLEPSRMVHLAKWKALLSCGEVTLVCFCKSGVFCHRVLLAEYLVELCKGSEWVVEYKGER